MALATVDIVRRTGASGTITDTSITSTNTRASTSDVSVPGGNNPLPVPGAGTTYSYWVSTRLTVAANPDGHTVNNLKWYTTTSSVPPGTTILGRDASTGADAGYRQATGTLGVTGTQLTTGNHSGLDGTPVDVFGLTSAVPQSLGGTTATTGQFGDHFVFQVGIDTTVTPVSPASSNTFRWRYDEA